VLSKMYCLLVAAYRLLPAARCLRPTARCPLSRWHVLTLLYEVGEQGPGLVPARRTTLLAVAVEGRAAEKPDRRYHGSRSMPRR